MNNQFYKADAGKLRPELLMHGCPRALLLISAVLSYGAQKYEAHSWKKVSRDRYESAKYRHVLEELAGMGDRDKESGLLHEAHAACNVLFTLQSRVEDLSEEEFRELLRFNEPPQDHKKVA